VRLRSISASDRDAIRELLGMTERFTLTEIGVALELVEDALQNPHSDYQFVVAEGEDNHVKGYACWGKVAVSDSAWDLYWIAVDPAEQNRGVGAMLMRHVEDNVMFHQGKILLAETSSMDGYQSARGFYEKQGFRKEAEIRDYYRPGDNRVIYAKRMDQFH
jgi:ribosomal protein S18 acetylase RimI-like enzyme